MNPHYLSHSGVKGQKWYVRNYQTYKTRPTRSGKVGEERIYKVEKLTQEGIKQYNKPTLNRLRITDNTKGLIYKDKNGKLVGVVNTEKKKDGTTWIQGLEVFDEFKGKGISKTLLKDAETKLGATHLSVRKTNKIAKSLYDKTGWDIESEDDFMEYRKLKDKHELYKKNVKEKTNKLYNELDSWDYGVIINGKKYDETKLDKVNWKNYRTIPIDIMKKEKIGVCWDFVNYQHDFFKKNGIKDESYMMVMKKSDKPDDVLTHTWSVFYNGNKKYWFEQSWYPKRGIREIKDYKDVVQELYKFHSKDGKDRPYDIYRYNPDGMDKGLTDQEYFNLATKDDPVYQKRIK